PYSALVFGTSRLTSAINDADPDFWKKYAIASELTVGIIGTDAGKEFQTYIHRNHWLGSTRPIPLGWKTQISNGGEPTLMYKVKYMKPLYEAHWKKVPTNNMIQVIGSAEGSAGYYTNAAIGLNIRAGYFKTAYWHDSPDFGSSANQVAVEPKWFRDQCEGYFFASGRIRAVGYNALLQGQFKQSAHTFAPSQINNFIYEFETGFSVKLGGVTFIYEFIAGRTAEFNTDLSRTHIWGAASLSYQRPEKPKSIPPAANDIIPE
ncbi:MAG TPA: lipid A-modifier LpxR family protein, partial [Bacteroidia bacterium]|nr:lipid A-modifier LpxR family protein [Bacteroidia bacterium]